MPASKRRNKATDTVPQTPNGSDEDVVKPASEWHNDRRVALLNDRKVKELLKYGNNIMLPEMLISIAVTLGICWVHSTVAQILAWLWQASSGSFAQLVVGVLVVLAAASVGAVAAYALQALNHEMGHSMRRLGGPFTVEKYVWSWLLYFAGALGSGFCHVPWSAYYYGTGHARHHVFAGSQRDVDAEALFWLWEAPVKGPVRRFLWASMAAIMIPVAYMVSLLAYAIFDFRSNILELRLVAFDAFCKWAVFTYVAGAVNSVGGFYFFLSSGFSMGFLCHPLMGFWILQHLCVNGKQPTVSYYGSSLWNWLTLNELMHVEHHDLSQLHWRHLPKLRQLRPDLYDHLYVQMSVVDVAKAWVMDDTTAAGFAWDFGCRKTWGCHSVLLGSRVVSFLFGQDLPQPAKTQSVSIPVKG